MLVMVECLFPDVGVDKNPTMYPVKKNNRPPKEKKRHDAKLVMQPLIDIEKCLLARLFFRRDLTQDFLGLIFSRHHTSIFQNIWHPFKINGGH